MTKKRYILFVIIAQLSICNFINAQHSNNTVPEIEKSLKYHDSIFWQGYNTCDLEIMEKYVSDDLEFYHDKSGVSLGRESFIKTVKKNLCSNPNFKLRREALKESIKIYPINNYGAIISGDHIFYITENNTPEYLDGISKFTNLWQFKDGVWKMTRVLSYDHKAPPANIDKKEIVLSSSILKTFTGKYKAPNSGNVSIASKDGKLIIQTDKNPFVIFPISESTFFSKEAPLTFQFIKNNNGKVTKMIVKENGKVVEEITKLN